MRSRVASESNEVWDRTGALRNSLAVHWLDERRTPAMKCDASGALYRAHGRGDDRGRAGSQHVGVLRLLFARGLGRLRRKWRDVLDQLRVVLVAYSIRVRKDSDRTQISRVHAWERQIVGGGLATRRTGRRSEVPGATVLARNVPAQPQANRPRCEPWPVVRPKSWEVSPFRQPGAPPRGQIAMARTQETRAGRHASFLK